MPDPAVSVTEGLVVVWVISIMVLDLMTRRIPNQLSIGAALAALVFLLTAGETVLGTSWQSAVLGGLLGLGLTLPAHLTRHLGAGDVKLILAIALIGGWQAVLISYVVAGLLGGVAAVGQLLLKHFFKFRQTLSRRLPFGALLSLGVLVSMCVRS